MTGQGERGVLARGAALWLSAGVLANCAGESTRVNDTAGASQGAVGGDGLEPTSGRDGGGRAGRDGSGGTPTAAGSSGSSDAGGELGTEAGGAPQAGRPSLPDAGDSASAAGAAGVGGHAATSGSAGDAGDTGEAGEGGHGEPAPNPCGNGRLDATEVCDDGNLLAGDGCTGACALEPGFTCTSALCEPGAERCQLRLPITFRDFNAHDETGGHPDFSPGFNSDGAIQGLLLPELDADGKPVLRALNSSAYMHGVERFAEWYRDVPNVNARVPREIVLWNDGDGAYSNRWGANGERWPGPAGYTNVTFGGTGGDGCPLCETLPGGACYDPCLPWGASSTQACCAVFEQPLFDGTPLFYPIDDAPNLLSEQRWAAKVPEQFGWAGWPWEEDVATYLGQSATVSTAWTPFPTSTHNFSFTSELRLRFRHAAGSTEIFSIEGDDDLWLFLNGRLAIDLGSWHLPLPGTLTIAGDTVTVVAQTDLAFPPHTVTETRSAIEFGLEDGGIYEVAIFHAERQREGSVFRVGVKGINLARSLCVTD